MNLTVQEILEDLHAAERDCQLFEQKYGVLSEYFYVAYMNGALDDDGNPDFALWAGSYEVKLNRENAYMPFFAATKNCIGTIPKLIRMTPPYNQRIPIISIFRLT